MLRLVFGFGSRSHDVEESVKKKDTAPYAHTGKRRLNKQGSEQDCTQGCGVSDYSDSKTAHTRLVIRAVQCNHSPLEITQTLLYNKKYLFTIAWLAADCHFGVY